MLDGRHKIVIDRFWDRLAHGLARLKISPNQVTWAGLVLVLVNCGLFSLHRDTLWFGLGLAIAFAFDALDGAVARITKSTSNYGGYLDAVVDRYQEVVVYFTIAWVTGYWMVCFLAITGSLLISYNKARTAIEIPIDNNRWPDLLERLERLVYICLALVIDPLINSWIDLPERFLFYAIAILAVLTHLTAAQRFFRARQMLHSDSDSDS